MAVWSRVRPRRSSTAVLGAFVVAALLTSCATADGESDPVVTRGASVENGLVGAAANDSDRPVEGGAVAVASYTSVTTLDPAKTPALGSTGGTEMAAVYDVLMRYDEASRAFVPQLAESLRASDDRKIWTLALRDGVTFSDGSVLDADAAMRSIRRHSDQNGPGSQLWKSNVEAVDSDGPLSITFTLKQPWTEFPAMLAAGYGMIVAPAATSGGAFTPIGAGPFVVEQFRPHEELRLRARDDYRSGRPHLDMLRFVGVAGDVEKIQALDAGDVQVAHLRSAEAVRSARAEDRAGYVETMPLANVLLINNRQERPGGDVRVRQAIAHAIDLDSFNERVDKGAGLPDSAVFPEWSPLHSGGGGLGFDPDKARQLLAAAKQDGFDGNLAFLGVAAPKSQTTALAVQSMLQAVGFTVTIDMQNSTADVTKKLNVDRDYDISYAGIALPEGAPVNKLMSALRSDSNSNYLGYANPDMDDLLNRLQVADGDDGRRALMGEFQALVNDTAPFVVIGAAPVFTIWEDNVHGIVPSVDSIMLFDQAWIS